MNDLTDNNPIRPSLFATVYERLTQEERDEVDAYRAKPEGVDPMVGYEERYYEWLETRSGEWAEMHTISGKVLHVKIGD